MNEPRESIFDTSQFTDSETGGVNNISEFDRQITAIIEEGGDITPALTYVVDRMTDCDESEERFLSALLMHLMELVDDPDAVFYHAQRLTPYYEEREEWLSAAATSHLAASVQLEKRQFKHAGSWVAKMRENLSKQSFDEAELTDADKTFFPAAIKRILDFENEYFLTLADFGKAKQARREITVLMENPVVPAEGHVLASTMGYIEEDARIHTLALQ